MEVKSNKMKPYTKTLILLLMFFASSYSFEDCLKKLKITDVKIYQFYTDKFKIDSTVVSYWIAKQLDDYAIKSSESNFRTYLTITVSTSAIEQLNGVIFNIRTEVLKPNLNDGSFIRYFYTDNYGIFSEQTYKDDLHNEIKNQVNSFIHSWVQARK